MNFYYNPGNNKFVYCPENSSKRESRPARKVEPSAGQREGSLRNNKFRYSPVSNKEMSDCKKEDKPTVRTESPKPESLPVLFQTYEYHFKQIWNKHGFVSLVTLGTDRVMFEFTSGDGKLTSDVVDAQIFELIQNLPMTTFDSQGKVWDYTGPDVILKNGKFQLAATTSIPKKTLPPVPDVVIRDLPVAPPPFVPVQKSEVVVRKRKSSPKEKENQTGRKKKLMSLDDESDSSDYIPEKKQSRRKRGRQNLISNVKVETLIPQVEVKMRAEEESEMQNSEEKKICCDKVETTGVSDSRKIRKMWRDFQKEDEVNESVTIDDFQAMSVQERIDYVRWRENEEKRIKENTRFLLEMEKNAKDMEVHPSEEKDIPIVKDESDEELLKRNQKLLVRAQKPEFEAWQRATGVYVPYDGSSNLRVISVTKGLKFLSKVDLKLRDIFGQFYLTTFLLFALILITLCFCIYFSFWWGFETPYAIFANVAVYSLVYAQSKGHYVVPVALSDKLYYARMVFIIAHLTHLIAHLVTNNFVYLILRYLEFWYLTDPLIAMVMTAHFAILGGWGIATTPLYLCFIVGLGNTVVLKKRNLLRGAHYAKLLKYGSVTGIHPMEAEAREMVEEARRRAEKASVSRFLESGRDPFLVSSLDDVIPRTRNWDFSQDLRPVRMHRMVEFKDVAYKRPHFDQVLVSDGHKKHESVVVCRELVNEATRISFMKFQDKCTGDSSGSLLASMMTVLNDVNMPFDANIYYNSVTHGFRLYLLTLQTRASGDKWLKLQSVVTGLSNGSFGRMRARWFERNFDLDFDSSYYTRLSTFVAMETLLILRPFFGYVWRYIPEMLKEKKFTDMAPRLRMDWLGDLKRAITSYSILAYCEPIPDVSNADNLIAGVEARLNVGKGKTGVLVGHAEKFALKELRETVKKDLLNWEPLHVLPTRDEWLEQTKNYSAAKKEMLRLLEDTGSYFDTMFVKWESYTGFKAPRIISNSDKRFLVIEGPIVKAMEPQLEKLNSTLTGIPVSQWSTAVLQRIGPYENNPSFKIYVSDISSFESAITPEIKDVTENLVFDRILINFPREAKQLRARQRTRHYEKNIRNYRISYDYVGRASGDARTYCGNTIVNHYLLKNLYARFKIEELPYFVSGDDAIFVMPSNIPQEKIVDYYISLGFDVKLNETEVRNSGFCGFNFDPHSYARMADDPVTVMIKFFTSQQNLTMSKYRRYLQDQALCLLHEYPADPVLRKGVDWMIKNLPASTYQKRDWWQQEIMKEGNHWRELILLAPVDFQTYAENHYEGKYSAQHYAALSELFYDCIVLLFTGHPFRAREKFQCAMEKIDVGTPRAAFNAFANIDPYGEEFCTDIDKFYMQGFIDFVDGLSEAVNEGELMQ